LIGTDNEFFSTKQRTNAIVCTTVNAGQALLVAAIWGLVLAAVSTVMFIKRDVLQ